jgi:biotin carboxylase
MSSDELLTSAPVSRIVIIGFWSPCLAFARRVKQAGVAVHLIDLADEPTEFRRHSDALEPEGDVLLWRDAKTPKGLEQVVAFVNRVGADAIITADEYTQLWLAKNRDRFEPACRVLAPSAEALEIILKKPEQTDLARQSGFNVLPSWELETRADSGVIPKEFFPVCVRPGEPDSVQPEFKAMVLDSPRDLQQFLNRTEWKGAPLVVQPYCFGPNVVVHGVRGEDGHMIALRAFLAYRKSRGFAVSLRSCRLPADVRAACVKFVQMSNITGAFHYDLLQSARSGRMYFLEVNVRMGGTTAKVMGMGYDEPMLLLNSFGLAAPQEAPSLSKDERNVTGKRLAIAQLVDTLRQRHDPLSYPNRSWLVDVFSGLWETVSVPDVHFNWRDLRGSLWYMLRLHNAEKAVINKAAV